MSKSSEEGAPQGDSSAENGAQKDANGNIYENRAGTKKIIRVVTVLAYVFSVSFTAILLSAYYIFLWEPPNPRTIQRERLSNDPQVEYLADYLSPNLIALNLSEESLVETEIKNLDRELDILKKISSVHHRERDRMLNYNSLKKFFNAEKKIFEYENRNTDSPSNDFTDKNRNTIDSNLSLDFTKNIEGDSVQIISDNKTEINFTTPLPIIFESVKVTEAENEIFTLNSSVSPMNETIFDEDKKFNESLDDLKIFNDKSKRNYVDKNELKIINDTTKVTPRSEEDGEIDYDLEKTFKKIVEEDKRKSYFLTATSLENLRKIIYPKLRSKFENNSTSEFIGDGVNNEVTTASANEEITEESTLMTETSELTTSEQIRINLNEIEKSTTTLEELIYGNENARNTLRSRK